MPADADDLATIAKPFMLLAVVAFVLGFLVTVMVARPGAVASAGDRAAAVTVSGPSSAEWNLPKRI